MALTNAQIRDLVNYLRVLLDRIEANGAEIKKLTRIENSIATGDIKDYRFVISDSEGVVYNIEATQADASSRLSANKTAATLSLNSDVAVIENIPVP